MTTKTGTPALDGGNALTSAHLDRQSRHHTTSALAKRLRDAGMLIFI